MWIIFILIIIIPIIFYLLKPILRKLDIPKATISRAKLIQKEVWSGGNMPNPYVRVREIIPKTEYLLTFAYMEENSWGNHKFIVPFKVYEAIAVGDEGILKHHYTEFVSFDKFEK